MKVIAIISSRYSGSTLLDFMLGSHSCGFSLTEIRSFIDGNRKPFSCKTCSPPQSCPIWTPEFTNTLRVTLPSEIYNKIQTQSGKTLLIDSSKNVSWFNKALSKIPYEDKLIVLIVKSPHRYIASELTKIHKSTPEGVLDALDRWVSRNLHFLKYLSDYGNKFLIVKYEDLITYPVKILSNILRQLNLDYEENMELFWSNEHHPLWGNPGARSHLSHSDTSNPANFSISEIDQRIYRKMHQKLYMDNKWENVLDQGAVNKIFSSKYVSILSEKLNFHHPLIQRYKKCDMDMDHDLSWVNKWYYKYLITESYPRRVRKKLRSILPMDLA